LGDDSGGQRRATADLLVQSGYSNLTMASDATIATHGAVLG